MVRSRARARRDQRASTPSAPRRCRACSASIPRADLKAYGTLKCIVPFKNRDGSEMKKPERRALADRQGALRRRSGRLRRRRDAAAGQDAAEAVALDIEPLPAVTLASDAAQAGRAAALRRRAGQYRARLSLSATARRSPPPSPSAAHVTQTVAAQHAPRREFDGAARGDRRLRHGQRNTSRCMPAARASSA